MTAWLQSVWQYDLHHFGGLVVTAMVLLVVLRGLLALASAFVDGVRQGITDADADADTTQESDA